MIIKDFTITRSATLAEIDALADFINPIDRTKGMETAFGVIASFLEEGRESMSITCFEGSIPLQNIDKE